MAAITLEPSFNNFDISRDPNQHGTVVEEIQGLIRVYKDGHVERFPIVPCVATSLSPALGVTSLDEVIDKFMNIWVRFYVPNTTSNGKIPLMVYFHGGGFCVGSAAWSCYHEFLANLADEAGCMIMSVNYRLAPENPLPAAYEDGFKALMWLKRKVKSQSTEGWFRHCDFYNIYLGGDSAGANIAYNIATRLGSNSLRGKLKPLLIKGIILIQPFIGGQRRTDSEKYSVQPTGSALTLAASDTYWGLSLPRGSNRDHPWCNPMTAKGLARLPELRLLPMMVCVSGTDILRDRNLKFCEALGKAGKTVERVVLEGVGHAFQILSKSKISQFRCQEMVARIKAFVSR